MNEQVLFSGVTPLQLTDIIINGIKEELGNIFNSQKQEQKEKQNEYFTIKEACNFLKCSETKLWRLRKKGRFTSYKNERGVLLKKCDLEDYISSSKQ